MVMEQKYYPSCSYTSSNRRNIHIFGCCYFRFVCPKNIFCSIFLFFFVLARNNLKASYYWNIITILKRKLNLFLGKPKTTNAEPRHNTTKTLFDNCKWSLLCFFCFCFGDMSFIINPKKQDHDSLLYHFHYHFHLLFSNRKPIFFVFFSLIGGEVFLRLRIIYTEIIHYLNVLHTNYQDYKIYEHLLFDYIRMSFWCWKLKLEKLRNAD